LQVAKNEAAIARKNLQYVEIYPEITASVSDGPEVQLRPQGWPESPD